jgi:hypothetical protein
MATKNKGGAAAVDPKAAAKAAATRPDPRRDADAYLEKHNLLKLFQDLGTLLVHHRPDDPRAFLLEKLVQFKDNKGVLPFFTKTDAKAMFGMFDRTNKGSITPEQCVAWRA